MRAQNGRQSFFRYLFETVLRGSPWSLPSAVTCAYGLKSNPLAVEKGNDFTVNRQKDLTGISNVTISADLHGRLALEEFPKTSSHVLKTTLPRSYTDKTLLLAY